jgi:hypothetical protein
MDQELEQFKASVDLLSFACHLGWEPDPSGGAGRSRRLCRGGQKIVVTTSEGAGAPSIWCEVGGGGGGGGSVVDLAKLEVGGSLGRARQLLRGWLGGARPSPAPRPAPAPPAPGHDADVAAAWAAMSAYQGAYLSRERGLEGDLVRAWGVRQDARRNACFAHFSGGRVVGWEVKNARFSGFASGGRRGLGWVRLDKGRVTQIVVGEASIDLMSWAQLHGRPRGAAYASLGGSLTAPQVELIRRAAEGTACEQIVVATDADPAGDQMAARVAALGVGDMKVPGLKVVRARPALKDWNADLLAARLTTSFPYCPAFFRRP